MRAAPGPFLYLLYRFFRMIVRGAFWHFYPYYIVIGEDRLSLNGPVIIVSNHPNTMMDPMHIASRVNKVVYYLANSGLFQTWFSHWFFSTFFCIPVKRKVDSENKRVNNSQTFQATHKFLEKGGSLWIAVQGGSYRQNRIGDLKVGAARIALDVEAKNDFQVGVKILPIGLSYSHPDHYGGGIIINVGESISPLQFKNQYNADPSTAYSQLTQHVKEKLGDLVIDASSEEIEEIGLTLADLKYNRIGSDQLNWFREAQKCIKSIEELPVEQLNNCIKKWKLIRSKSGETPINYPIIKGKASSFKFTNVINYILFNIGRLHFLPAEGIVFLASKYAPIHPIYKATVKVVLSVFIYPIWVYFLFNFYTQLLGNEYIAIFAVLLIIFLTRIFVKSRMLFEESLFQGNNLDLTKVIEMSQEFNLRGGYKAGE